MKPVEVEQMRDATRVYAWRYYYADGTVGEWIVPGNEVPR